jgi:hypothetical protein
MKKGDEVISVGDAWVCAGSKGRIELMKSNGNTAYVIWHYMPDRRHKPGTGLYHNLKHLRLVDGTIDPNIAFMVRERKRT